SDPTVPGSSSRPHDHGAWTSPAPTRVAGSGNRRALAWSCRHRLMARRLADVSAHSAAQPATCGVAMLVPLFVPYRTGIGTDEKTSLPGPAISILPRCTNEDRPRSLSSDATDMIVGEFAGLP